MLSASGTYSSGRQPCLINPAFEASREGINRLKKLVPVWKKEYFVDGEVWVDGEWDESVVKAQ